MSFILGFLGTIFGILGAIAIIIGIIYYKLSKTLGKRKLKELINVAKNASNIEIQEYQEQKNVSGMTNLLEPIILEDFPEFNKDLLFNTVEESLRKILDAIQNKSMKEIKNEEKLDLMCDTIEKVIKNYKTSNIDVEYKDIKFHRHAIKDYRKLKGKATVTISSTLEYYYKTNKKSEKVFENIKKQTRYTTKFCYVYDEAKFEEKDLEFSISCQNCGAPIKGTKDTVCEYCSSPVQAINLKAWKMIYYKEDY